MSIQPGPSSHSSRPAPDSTATPYHPEPLAAGRREEVSPMESEILSDEELAEITGYKARGWQRRWLDDHRWHYVESRGKRPLVGRLYARQKLGILAEPGAFQPPPLPAQAWTPDLSRVK